MSDAQTQPKEKILFVANAMLASLQLSFIGPLADAIAGGEIASEYLFETDLTQKFGKDKVGAEAKAWIIDRLNTFRPTLIVLCRYSAPHASAIVDWARCAQVPVLFHIDDDLLNVPDEAGKATSGVHNDPARLATIRYLLDEATLVYCSTKPLLDRFFGNDPPLRALAGEIYCAHPVMAAPKSDGPPIVGYMGTRTHAADLDLAVPAIERLLDEDPEVRFEIFGAIKIPERLMRFGDRVNLVEQVQSYAAFVERLASLPWTVGLCPLAATPFNATKADTKWVEYTASGFAVVASRGTVYDQACDDGCGLLVSGEAEWLAAIRTLLKDRAAHRTQVENAQEKLRRVYNPGRLQEQVRAIMRHAHDLVEKTAHVPNKDEPRTLMNLEQLHGNVVQGWAWSTRDREMADDMRLPVEIWCGTTRLGYAHRRVGRSDVDYYVGDHVGAKGFMLPVACLNALWRLFGLAEDLHPMIRFANHELSLHTFNPLLRDLSEFRTLRTVDGRPEFHVVDLWWASGRLLKIRTMKQRQSDSAEEPATLLRLYQPVLGENGRVKLAVIDEVPLEPKGTILVIGARSPVMPILLIGATQDGEIRFSDLIPFPSLLRGGLHEAEVPAVAEQGGTLADIRRVSDACLAELAGTINDQRPFGIGALVVDVTMAIGTELIFDPTIRAWLTAVFQLSVAAGNGEARIARDLGDSSFADHAVARLSALQPNAPRTGRATLTLSNDAIPTISALVSRRLGAPAGVGHAPYIITDEAVPSRRTLVATSALGLPASAAAFVASRDHWPTLTWIGSSEAAAVAGGSALPVAIAYRDLAPLTDAQLTFPVPKDRPEIVPAQPGAEPARTTIIVPLRHPDEDVRALVSSIAGQTVAGGLDLLLAVQNKYAERLTRQKDLLDEMLPGRSRLLNGLDGLNRGAALDCAAETANGDVLLILDPGVILHDHRTVETLARLAGSDGIGTVGCMQLKLRNTGDGVPVFKSAGFFPGRFDFALAPHLALKALRSVELLPRAIYPVAANSPHCYALSTAAWREVGGFKNALLPDVYAEVDLAIRLAEAGRTNLCTTLLSVFSDFEDNSRGGWDVYAATNLDIWRLLPALRASTTLRNF